MISSGMAFTGLVAFAVGGYLAGHARGRLSAWNEAFAMMGQIMEERVTAANPLYEVRADSKQSDTVPDMKENAWKENARVVTGFDHYTGRYTFEEGAKADREQSGMSIDLDASMRKVREGLLKEREERRKDMHSPNAGADAGHFSAASWNRQHMHDEKTGKADMTGIMGRFV